MRRTSKHRNLEFHQLLPASSRRAARYATRPKRGASHWLRTHKEMAIWPRSAMPPGRSPPARRVCGCVQEVNRRFRPDRSDALGFGQARACDQMAPRWPRAGAIGAVEAVWNRCSGATEQNSDSGNIISIDSSTTLVSKHASIRHIVNSRPFPSQTSG